MARQTLSKSACELLGESAAGSDVLISGIAGDSRNVVAGSLFCAVSGAHSNGHDFVDDALQKGAVAIAAEKAIIANVPCFVSAGLKSELSGIASRFYNEPTQSMHVVGITGTNGKSSVASYVRQLLEALDESCASIGTLGVESSQCHLPTNNTTPGAIELQQIFYDLSQSGVDAVALEVSSHAMDQCRCEAVDFDTAVFTNLSHDHLDYHQTMGAYLQAKQKLFAMDCVQNIIVNADDDYADAILSASNASSKTLSYSLQESSADLFLKAKVLQDGKQCMQWVFKGMTYSINTQLVGHFNIANLMAAFLTVVAKGYEPEIVAQKCEAVSAVAGRMQFVPSQNRLTLAVVDYAHTPDALENTLTALKEYQQGKLICVFGCGGDRDRAKRPLMAAIAEKYSDMVIVTADNPRSEPVDKIAEDICQGFNGENYQVVHDRKQAIIAAVAGAGREDIVVVAGKGHESYQIIAGETLVFDDVAVLSQVLLGGDPCH